MSKDAAPATPHMFSANGYVSHWWGALPAVPASKDSPEYRRLRRVWFDHTRFRGPKAPKDRHKSISQRYHEFVRPVEETNLTVTLWENFSIFGCDKWLPVVL